MESMERMEVKLTMADGRGMMDDVVTRLKEFVENEMRSCSMDYGCITPLYVYRMWGGTFSIEEIENGFTELRKLGYTTSGFTEIRSYGNKDL